MLIETLFLADFSVIKPDIGLIFWTTLVFLTIWGLLGRFAFRPIQEALKDRENSIQSALDEAKKAKEEMANLQAANQDLLRQAQEERGKILKEAREAKETIIAEAREKAKEDAKRILNDSKRELENQKLAAMTEVKNQSGTLALEIAEKIIRKQLQGSGEHEAFANSLVDEIKLN